MTLDDAENSIEIANRLWARQVVRWSVSMWIIGVLPILLPILLQIPAVSRHETSSRKQFGNNLKRLGLAS